jgi:hypothetical protein
MRERQDPTVVASRKVVLYVAARPLSYNRKTQTAKMNSTSKMRKTEKQMNSGHSKLPSYRNYSDRKERKQPNHRNKSMKPKGNLQSRARKETTHDLQHLFFLKKKSSTVQRKLPSM